jgi:hypothetical protein
MSYVAITQRLTNEIANAIHKMAAAEVSGEKEPEESVLSGAEDWLAPKLWGVLHGTQFERHSDLTCSTREISFQITDCYDGRAGGYNVSLSCAGVPRWHFTDKDGATRYSFQPIPVTRSTHPYFEAYSNHMRACKEINARWEEVKKQIIDFLGACKSVNEAVKLWPDIGRYLSADVKKKIEEKTEKPKRDSSEAMAKLAAMDVEKITTSTVLARLVSAGTGS